jgi:alcohol dehydrogenase (cytochrome c)
MDDRQLRSRHQHGYWGTGNASPWFGDQRPGDNLDTSRRLRPDGDTGKIKGHFSTIRMNRGLGRNECANLVDFQSNGAPTKGLLGPARNGYPYWLKRDTDGSIVHLRSQASCRRMLLPASTRKPGGLKSIWRNAGHRQVGPVLPRPLGRQGLAV